MSLPALIGFAGVLVAAVATGLLAGRAVRQPRPDTILWTAATLALTIALAAQSMGFASGFGPATFRAVQLFALMLAPLWLAWGLVEQGWPSEAARFGTRLVCGALTVVGSVILATDPLTAGSFGKAWPLAGPHYQAPSHYALDVVQAVAVILAGVSIGLAAARARNEGPWPGALPGTAVVGLAVFVAVGLRFSLPTRAAYPLLSALAAVLAWYGATRLEPQPGRISRDAGIDIADDAADRPEARYEANGQSGPNGYGDPVNGGQRAPGDIRGPGGSGRWAEADRRPPQAPRTDWPRGGPAPVEPAPQAKPAALPYGRILIFTLLDDRVADFDRFAEQAAEEVRTREPGTLVYVIHVVPNAPLQRIFYEIYRDRAAFDSHENQPYMQRFVADRRACVLATNVIELRLKYAKVAPLPGSLPPGPPPAAARPQSLEPLPPRPDRRLPSADRRYGGI